MSQYEVRGSSSLKMESRVAICYTLVLRVSTDSWYLVPVLNCTPGVLEYAGFFSGLRETPIFQDGSRKPIDAFCVDYRGPSTLSINKFELIIKGCRRVMAVRPVLCTPPRRVTPREMLMSDF